MITLGRDVRHWIIPSNDIIDTINQVPITVKIHQQEINDKDEH